MKLGTEDNNSEKESARIFLSNELQHYFGRKKYSMLELLGSGVGAEFFLANQKAMKSLACVEMDSEKYSWWVKNKLHPLTSMHPNKGIESFNIDLYKFYHLAKLRNMRYDAINLDTMQYIGPKAYVSKQKTVFEHLERIFEYDVIAKKGLLLLNVMIDGFRILQGPYKDSVCKNQDEILALVKEAADNYGYDIDTDNASGYAYKSGGKGWATMLHSVIPVTKRRK